MSSTAVPSRAEAAQAERRRLLDLYQAGLIELVELQRRAKELDGRRRSIAEQHQTLTEQRDALAKDNRLRQRIGAFAERAIAALDGLDFDQRQQLLRTVVEEVRVTGWKVDIRLRIPLDEGPGQRYDLKLWIGSGDGARRTFPDDKSWKRRRGERRRGRNAAC